MHVHAPPLRVNAKRRQVFANNDIDWVFAHPEARRQRVRDAHKHVETLLREAFDKQKLPSLAYGLVLDGALVRSESLGFADIAQKRVPDANTAYRIGSITKSFTALATLMLRDRGELALDAPLARYLPEASALVYATRDAQPLTIRQLLMHRSGLPRLGSFNYAAPDANVTEADVLKLEGFALQNAPDRRFVYSNLGYGLLGLVVQRVGKKRYRDFVDAELLRPLGMTATVWDPEQVPAGELATAYRHDKAGVPQKTHLWKLGASEGAGGLYSTVTDMARYVALHLSAYPPRNAPETAPIRRSSVREAHAAARPSGRFSTVVRATEDGRDVRTFSPAYGFGWGVSQSCAFDFLVGHSGGTDGFASNVSMVPNYGLGVVLFANSNKASLGGLASRILETVVKRASLSKRTIHLKRAKAFEPAMSKLLALYNRWDDAGYEAMLAEGRRRIPVEEKAELAGYRALHGKCTGYTPIEVASPLFARFALQCERNKLTMQVSIDQKDSLIRGFLGVSRGMAAPPEVTAAAKKLLNDQRDKLGRCSPGAYSRHFKRHELAVSCARGGTMLLSLELDPDDASNVTSHTLKPKVTGRCPKL